MAGNMPLPELPDLVLPELPDFEDFDHVHTPECPICQFYEERVCRPYATKGDPKECAEDIMRTRQETASLSREERIKALTETFTKYGIDPNMHVAPKGL